jgi:energy-coupling factor transporter ATP-binding protein EcfA2
VAKGGEGRKGGKGGVAFTTPQRLRDVSATPLERWRTGLNELDFVVGGGFVPGSLTLIGGEPGIGKSTLLLQAAGKLEQSGRVVLYSSGEESTEQLQLRAERLGGGAGAVHAIGETRLEAILEAAASISADVLVLDSIQTVATDSLESAPATWASARMRRHPDALRGSRHRRTGGGSCHQGRRDRRSQDTGAHRRYGAHFEGETRSTTGCCARRRTGSVRSMKSRVHDVGAGAGAGGEPVGAVPAARAANVSGAP